MRRRGVSGSGSPGPRPGRLSEESATWGTSGTVRASGRAPGSSDRASGNSPSSPSPSVTSTGSASSEARDGASSTVSSAGVSSRSGSPPGSFPVPGSSAMMNSVLFPSAIGSRLPGSKLRSGDMATRSRSDGIALGDGASSVGSSTRGWTKDERLVWRRHGLEPRQAFDLLDLGQLLQPRLPPLRHLPEKGQTRRVDHQERQEQVSEEGQQRLLSPGDGRLDGRRLEVATLEVKMHPGSTRGQARLRARPAVPSLDYSRRTRMGRVPVKQGPSWRSTAGRFRA